MLGLFGIFGRSRDVQRLDQALDTVGLRARTVPDAVKLAALKQMREASGDTMPGPEACAAAAELLGYCAMGAESFAELNGSACAAATETRLTNAIEAGEGLDARLVLLTLHAGLIQESVVRRYDLTAD
jgi:hypothetical protein